MSLKQVNIYMNEKFHNKVKRAAQKAMLSVSKYIQIAVKEKMDREDK